MKKRRFAVLGSLLLAAALCACGQTETEESVLDPDSPVTVTIWHYYNGVQQTQFDAMVEEFNNTTGKEQGIVVEASSKNSVSELAESILASVNDEPGADEAPDIFGTYAETAYQIDQKGMLVDLAQYMTEEEMDEYVDEYIEEGSLGQEGALKIFPTAKSTEVMIVNATDWEKFAEAENVSYDDLKTYEGLTETAAKYYAYTDALTETANDGKAFFGMDSVANYMLVGAKQLGHPFAEVDEDGNVTVAADEATVKKLWENYYVPYVKGYFAAENRYRSDDAKVGAILALSGSTTSSSYYPTEVTIDDEYTYPIENVVLAMPNFADGEKYIVQQGAGMSVLASDEKTEYACTVFLKWFTETERNIEFSENSGYLPVKKEANETEKVSVEEDEDVNETMKNAIETAIGAIGENGLYTSPPYAASASVRTYLEDTMETTAAEAREAVKTRLADGEDAETVWEEYTDDAAFAAWYASFEAGLKETAGE